MTACTYLATISVAMATAGRGSQLTLLGGGTRHTATAASGGNCVIGFQTLTLLAWAGEVYACSRNRKRAWSFSRACTSTHTFVVTICSSNGAVMPAAGVLPDTGCFHKFMLSPSVLLARAALCFLCVGSCC